MVRTLILLILVGLFAGIALIDTAEAHHRGVAIRGEITKVDAQNGELTLKTRRGDVDVVFGARTRIVVDGQPATAADLKAGQMARVFGFPDRRNQVFRARGILARN